MSQPTSYTVEDDFLSIGRMFTEYRRLFDLSLADLQCGPVLDCGGGSSSFTATAAAMGADVRAVDPAYEQSIDALATDCEAALERTRDQLADLESDFVWSFYGDVDTRCRFLEAAHQRFLADYATNPDRYVADGLPALPFDDDSFALALCANLLFLYDDRLDRAFHEASLRELARVAEEVRVFPLHSLENTRSDLVTPVADSLLDDGYVVETRSVPYEFQPGANEMLVVE
jgi:ubiquinone/menaquinone biosynthesis C-methylase UbiE